MSKKGDQGKQEKRTGLVMPGLRPRLYDFSERAPGINGKMCPYCRGLNTERVSTKGAIQYRRCLETGCQGDVNDGQKKNYKVVGHEKKGV